MANVSLLIRLVGHGHALVLLPRTCDDRVVMRQSHCMFWDSCLVHKSGNLGYFDIGWLDGVRTALGARDHSTQSIGRRDGAIVYEQVGQ